MLRISGPTHQFLQIRKRRGIDTVIRMGQRHHTREQVRNCLRVLPRRRLGCLLASQDNKFSRLR